MITQMLLIQLQAEFNLNTPNSPGSEIVRQFLHHTLGAPGAHRGFFGQSLEQPTTAFIVTGWKTLEDHDTYIRSPEHEKHASILRAVLDPQSSTTMLRILFEQPSDDSSPAFDTTSNVGVTEIVLYHFPSPLTNKEFIMKSVDNMRPVIGRSEALAVYDGWALDEKTDDKGEKCSIYVNAVGWADVDAHMRFQGSDDFKQNVHHIMDLQDIRQFEMHHVEMYCV
ncbi:MAG: hypothetical protein Q9209_002986 [Squamulea sp. 1 TL-2023]